MLGELEIAKEVRLEKGRRYSPPNLNAIRTTPRTLKYTGRAAYEQGILSFLRILGGILSGRVGGTDEDFSCRSRRRGIEKYRDHA